MEGITAFVAMPEKRQIAQSNITNIYIKGFATNCKKAYHQIV